MEVVEINTKKPQPLPCRRPVKCPCNVKVCARKYVQPPREKSFAPEKGYKPPSKPLDVNTTYHLSYLNLNQAEMRNVRSQAIRPIPALNKLEGKFVGDTTNALSYKPFWNVVKTKPIVPRRRAITGTGRMECVSTARHDYIKKCAEKPEVVIPCGNIRTSKQQLDDKTTTKLSYMDPGPTEPTETFRPQRTYCPPDQPIFVDTTQKLSYQPFSVPEKEIYSWQQKPVYRPPDSMMCGKTTYSESFLKNDGQCMEQPVRPSSSTIFPYGAEFADKTIYKESFFECDTERPIAFVPTHSIFISDGKISGDTTNKLSYQATQVEKRSLILPRSRNMVGDGPMQSDTTNRLDFSAKETSRPELVLPCNNIRSSDAPLEDSTTTRMSYVKPGPIEFVQNFKPVVHYLRSEIKIDDETVNKLSYQPWTPAPREELPWASKGKYKPPTDPMCGDTIYHASFPAPGYYQDTCEPADCECLDAANNYPAKETE